MSTQPTSAVRLPPSGRAHPVRAARDLLTVRRVFGDPIVTADVTLVPVARLVGGAGFGDGEGEIRGDDARVGSGNGGGLGVIAVPVGTYVVRGPEVTWQPAVDMNRVILGGQVVGAIALLVIAGALRRRRR